MRLSGESLDKLKGRANDILLHAAKAYLMEYIEAATITNPACFAATHQTVANKAKEFALRLETLLILGLVVGGKEALYNEFSDKVCKELGIQNTWTV